MGELTTLPRMMVARLGVGLMSGACSISSHCCERTTVAGVCGPRGLLGMGAVSYVSVVLVAP